MTDSYGAGGFDFYLVRTMPDNTGIEISSEPDFANDLIIYPLPARDNITIDFSISNNTAVKFQLFDIAGRLLRADVADRAPGKHRINIAIKDLNPGVYIILVSNADQQLTKKILIVK